MTRFSSKTCRRCAKNKTLTEFYKHSSMNDGHLNFCKECVTRRVRNNRAANRAQYNARDAIRNKKLHRVAARKAYRQTPAGRAAHARSVEKWLKNNPNKRAAQIIVGNAIRNGQLISQPCEKCGKRRVQAHHLDYNKPLDVRWLCAKHHRAEHQCP